MILGDLSFLHLSIADVLDILMVAVLIFLIVRWLKGSSVMNIFIAILLLFITRLLVGALNMKMMSAILGTVIDVGAVALVVIFQPEIRRFMMSLGNRYRLGIYSNGLISRLLGIEEKTLDSASVNEITEACRVMGQEKTGALIVLPRKVNLEHIIETGDRVDARISRRIIMNIFFKNSPLHDGAMVISGDRIVSARCTLPITQRADIPPQLGMRHKAAFGMSEESDAVIIVVSEETGGISWICDGERTRIDNINELKLLLTSTLGSTTEGKK